MIRETDDEPRSMAGDKMRLTELEKLIGGLHAEINRVMSKRYDLVRLGTMESDVSLHYDADDDAPTLFLRQGDGTDLQHEEAVIVITSASEARSLAAELIEHASRMADWDEDAQAYRLADGRLVEDE